MDYILGGRLMRLKMVFAAVLIALLTACAPGMKPGAVVMKISEYEAHISMGSGSVRVGDRVGLFQTECGPQVNARRAQTSCRKVKVGEATVSKILNDRYSVIQVDPGVKLGEGFTVEELSLANS